MMSIEQIPIKKVTKSILDYCYFVVLVYKTCENMLSKTLQLY